MGCSKTILSLLVIDLIWSLIWGMIKCWPCLELKSSGIDTYLRCWHKVFLHTNITRNKQYVFNHIRLQHAETLWTAAHCLEQIFSQCVWTRGVSYWTEILNISFVWKAGSASHKNFSLVDSSKGEEQTSNMPFNVSWQLTSCFRGCICHEEKVIREKRVEEK